MSHYKGQLRVNAYTRHLTCLGMKMYDIGAEIPMLELKGFDFNIHDDASSFGENLARFPELAQS